MPDITKCGNIDCPQKEKCYRYTAKDNRLQSYALFHPKKNGECDHWWDKDDKQNFNQMKIKTPSNL